MGVKSGGASMAAGMAMPKPGNRIGVTLGSLRSDKINEACLSDGYGAISSPVLCHLPSCEELQPFCS
jgi:hypothetical protein